MRIPRPIVRLLYLLWPALRVIAPRRLDVVVPVPTIGLFEDLSEALGFPTDYLRQNVLEAAALAVDSPVIASAPGSLLNLLVSEPGRWEAEFSELSKVDGSNFIRSLVGEFYETVSRLEKVARAELLRTQEDIGVKLIKTSSKPFRVALAQLPPDVYAHVRDRMPYGQAIRYFLLSALANRHDEWLRATKGNI